MLARIVGDLGGEPGGLPLLQVALSAMFDRRHGNRVTHRDYDALGGVAGALAAQAERLVEQLSIEESKELRVLFGELVVPGTSTAENARRRVTLAELSEMSKDLCERLRDARLVITDRDPSSGTAG